MISITALVLTYNEEPNIGRTLSAIPQSARVLIIDSGSTDRTVEIAKEIRPDARIVERAFDTHTQQWNFGLDLAETPWILTLDADYELSKTLVQEIENLAPPDDIAGYAATFQYRIHGHPLRASVYPPRTVLFRKDKARYYQDGHTQILEAHGPVLNLAGRIFHDDRKPFRRWFQEQQRYAALEARHLLAMPADRLKFQDRLRRKIFLAAPLMFLYLLFAKGLLFDGWPGWIYVFQRTVAEVLLSSGLIAARRQQIQ